MTRLQVHACVSLCAGKARGIARVATPALVILPPRIEDEGWIQDSHLHRKNLRVWASPINDQITKTANTASINVKAACRRAVQDKVPP